MRTWLFINDTVGMFTTEQGWTICIIGKFIEIPPSESGYSEKEEDDETPNAEETPYEETPYDTLPCRIYDYVNSPETPNFSISSNGSRIETPERLFSNPYSPILVLVLHIKKKHLKDGGKKPPCVG